MAYYHPLEAEGFPASMWTDAHLAAMARTTASRMVTLDAEFHSFPGLDLLVLK